MPSLDQWKTNIVEMPNSKQCTLLLSHQKTHMVPYNVTRYIYIPPPLESSSSSLIDQHLNKTDAKCSKAHSNLLLTTQYGPPTCWLRLIPSPIMHRLDVRARAGFTNHRESEPNHSNSKNRWRNPVPFEKRWSFFWFWYVERPWGATQVQRGFVNQWSFLFFSFFLLEEKEIVVQECFTSTGSSNQTSSKEGPGGGCGIFSWADGIFSCRGGSSWVAIFSFLFSLVYTHKRNNRLGFASHSMHPFTLGEWKVGWLVWPSLSPWYESIPFTLVRHNSCYVLALLFPIHEKRW